MLPPQTATAAGALLHPPYEFWGVCIVVVCLCVFLCLDVCTPLVWVYKCLCLYVCADECMLSRLPNIPMTNCQCQAAKMALEYSGRAGARHCLCPTVGVCYAPLAQNVRPFAHEECHRLTRSQGSLSCERSCH